MFVLFVGRSLLLWIVFMILSYWMLILVCCRLLCLRTGGCIAGGEGVRDRLLLLVYRGRWV